MKERSRKFAEYVTTTWRKQHGVPPPPDRYNFGDKVIVHSRELTTEEVESLSPLMREAIKFRREADQEEGIPADRPATFLAYADFRQGKHLVFVEWENGDVTLTTEEELEHATGA